MANRARNSSIIYFFRIFSAKNESNKVSHQITFSEAIQISYSKLIKRVKLSYLAGGIDAEAELLHS